MPSEIDILEAVPKLVAEHVGEPWPDLVEGGADPCGADLCFKLGSHLFVVEAKSSSRAAQINQAIETLRRASQRFEESVVAVIAVPFMGEAGRQLCQEKAVGYIDLSGNALIQAPGLLVHIEGRPNKFADRGRPASVFAPRSSRVSRSLLGEPHRWWFQGELVERTELGRGYVSRIVRRLQEDGLLERDSERRLRPGNPELLLEAWRSEYSIERHDMITGHVTARTGADLTRRVADACHEVGARYAVTGLAGAALLAPFADYRRVSVYLDRLPEEGLLRRLGFRAEPRGANLWFMRPKDTSVFWGAKEVAGVRCGSPLQVYLDLKGMPERAQEAAEHLRDTHLKWSRDE